LDSGLSPRRTEVPRSITGTPLRRSARVAALLVAPAAAVALLSGCGVGQISQTDKMVPAVPGVEVTSPSSQAWLLNMQIKYNNPNGYPEGSTAPLVVYISNNSPDKPLVLRGVTATDKAGGTSLGTVVISGGAADIGINPGGAGSAGVPSATASATAIPSASATPAASASTPAAGASGSPAAGASPSPSSPSPTPSATGNATINLTIPPKGYARLSPDNGAYLAIAGLQSPITAGSSTWLTFTFDGEQPLSASVPFGIPLTPAPRQAPSGAPAE
jgi:hypothetical protein